MSNVPGTTLLVLKRMDTLSDQSWRERSGETGGAGGPDEEMMRAGRDKNTKRDLEKHTSFVMLVPVEM